MGYGKSIGSLIVDLIKQDKERSCDNCIKKKTINCPNSSKCYETLDKPYFERRRD